MYKVMLVDDDVTTHVMVRRRLENYGFKYCGATCPREGLEMLPRENPDLLLLDVMMPNINGFEVCRKLRDDGHQIPIIFLSSNGDIMDKSVGFSAGADDYVVKPFDPRELLLRVEAHIRRHQRHCHHHGTVSSGKVLKVGGLELHLDKYQTKVDGKPVSLTTKEFEICALLASQPGKVFSREQIQEHIWGDEQFRDSNNITVFVRKIREKLEADPSNPRYILTVQRAGYKMAEDLTQDSAS